MEGCGQKAARMRTDCDGGQMVPDCCERSTIVAQGTRLELPCYRREEANPQSQMLSEMQREPQCRHAHPRC